MPFKFVCVSIFFIFCLFGRTQLPAVAAAPYEYNEEHEQYPYDLETVQSKAKYDTRLLSQQLRAEQKSSEESDDRTDDQQSERGWRRHQKANEEEKAEQVNDNDNENDNDDMQPHERAASCFSHGHKYTHGQKVPRIDPCEVCLCMDGEIFCWWEKCGKIRDQPTSDMGTYKAKEAQSNKKMKTKLLKKQQFPPNTKPQKNQPQQRHKHPKYLARQEKPQSQRDSHMTKKHFSSQNMRPPVSKIMSFPENLPSVLYYDYHTEEHEHHKHQHRQQHLKRQMQKKIQKLQREQNRQQQKAKGLISEGVPSLLTTSAVTPEIQAHHDDNDDDDVDNGLNRISVSSPAMRGYDDMQTDSDILPEPPTKKPKFQFPKQSNRNSTMEQTQRSNFLGNDQNGSVHGLSSEWTARGTGGTHRLFVGETSATSSIFATDDVYEINKNANDDNSPKNSTHRAFMTMGLEVNKSNNNNNNEPQDDDAFHRWLTSTEIYNDSKNNNNKIVYNNRSYNDSYYDDNLPFSNENSYVTESSEFENPFGIQNLSINSQQSVRGSSSNNHNYSDNNNNNNNNNNIDSKSSQNNGNNGSNKLLYPKDQGRVKYKKNDFLRGASSSDYSDYNGSVVNIDISLTAQDEQQQHKQQQYLDFPKHEETEQLRETPALFAAGLILNRSDTKQTAKTINDTKLNAPQMGGSAPVGNDTETDSTIRKITSAMTAATSPSTTKTKAAEISRLQSVKSTERDDIDAGADTTKTSPTEPATTPTPTPTATATATTATTSSISPERHCNVMGTLYKIGEVLPQDTGNCLQCICIDGSTIDDTPRVTCSPHNCPPLVLPDLFDATGY